MPSLATRPEVVSCLPVQQLALVAATALYLLVVGCTPTPRRSPVPPKANPLPSRVQGASLRPVGDTRRGYGTRTGRYTMQRLKTLGVNTVSILLSGRMTHARSREIIPPSRSELIAAQRALDDARTLGLATVLVPHIYIDDGTWRGEIALGDDAHTDAWWNSYEAFIGSAAEIARATGTTVLSVGVELKSMSNQPFVRSRMSHLTQSIRKTYSGKLTYSANWDEAEDVLFWDLIDLVGVNGYYPLQPNPEQGAQRIRKRLQMLAKQTNREVLVAEVGYRSSPDSHLRPWEWPEQLQPAVDEQAQARAWSAVLKHWLGAHSIRGLIVWVVPTDPDDPASEPKHGFNPLNKKAETILREYFQKPLHHAQHLEPVAPVTPSLNQRGTGAPSN